MTFFDICLYAALTIGGLGLIFRAITWLNRSVGTEARQYTFGQRFAAAIKGVAATFLSLRFLTLYRVFIVDGLLQLHLIRRDFYRWLTHILIFMGFMLLLLMHALDILITEPLFAGYYSTVNPFLLLRNGFGAMVLVGVIMAIARRIRAGSRRRSTSGPDVIALCILAVIILSGFLLEATKITSYTRFNSMVAEYSDPTDKPVVAALRDYWAAEYGVVFPGVKRPFPRKTMERGRKVHVESCGECHSKPGWAFVSRGISLGLSPVAINLADAKVDVILWYVHFLACFLGLAYLPFSKFLHLFTAPLTLAINRVTDRRETLPANVATIQAIELDACTHCAQCSEQCSVGRVYEGLDNPTVLPADKLAAIRDLSMGRDLDRTGWLRLMEGSSMCTNCHRCTDVCPSGIDLQELWGVLHWELANKGYGGLFAWSTTRLIEAYGARTADLSAPVEPRWEGLQVGLRLSAQASNFLGCYGCLTCTNGCPVVAAYRRPQAELGLLPHQIMYALRLGLREEVLGARMLWDCLACYQCQEECPQGVRPADVLYELRNLAFESLRRKEVG